MNYIKIADTEHGELGHNGFAWVLNNPYPVGDSDHPAFYEETGILTVARGKGLEDDDCAPEVLFSKIFHTSRGGVAPRPEIRLPITVEQARAASVNRAEYDAVHKPAGGYRAIVD